MKKARFVCGVLLVVLLGDFGISAETTAQKSSVEVTFVSPEKFTDVRDAWAATNVRDDARRDFVIDELKSYLEKTARGYLADGQSLEVKITDVDLAGDFEPCRGLDFDDVRIVKDIYPPRVNLEFRLKGVDGVTLKEGKRELRDLSYLMSVALPASDALRYEKDLLRAWFAREFKRLKK